MLVKLANRILGRIPQHTTSYAFPIVYVLAQTDDGGLRQVQMTRISGRAEAETVIADVVARIESGIFMPDSDSGF